MASRGDYAAIYTGMADDPDFRGLTPDGKLVVYTLKMILGPSGIDVVRVFEPQMLELTGLSERRLRAALADVERAGWVLRDGSLVWLRNGLRYNPTLNLALENHRKGIERHLRGLPRQSLVARFRDYYGLDVDPSIPLPFDREGIGTPMGPPRDVDPDTDTETETEPENRKKKQSSGGKRRRTKEASKRETWLTPYHDAWAERYGGQPAHGQLAKALKPHHDADPDKCLTHWKRYVAETEGQYASPTRFAATFGEWAPKRDTILDLDAEREARQQAIAEREREDAARKDHQQKVEDWIKAHPDRWQKAQDLARQQLPEGERANAIMVRTLARGLVGKKLEGAA